MNRDKKTVRTGGRRLGHSSGDLETDNFREEELQRRHQNGVQLNQCLKLLGSAFFSKVLKAVILTEFVLCLS